MRFQVFNVVPKIPEPLSRLRELAFNLLWSWDENLRDVFLRIDRELFERVGQDPVQLLAQVPQERLEYLTVEDGFLTLYRNTLNHFQAGFDIFPRDLMARYFSDYAQEVGLGFDQFLALGHPAQGSDDSFNMAGLAIRTSAHVNAVSELHGKVSRSILSAYAPNVPEPEVPIGHVTNGAHTRSCVSREVGLLFDCYLGGDWWKGAGDPDTWQNIDSIPDEELWASHSRQRERLVSFTRRRLSEQVARRGGTPRDLEKARAVLSTRALAIGRGEDYDDYAYQDQVESDSL
jgi:alpha-glucan phosphorylase-like protein